MSHYQSEFTDAEKASGAAAFVAHIRTLINEMRMQTSVPKMKATDVREVALRALREAHGDLLSGLSSFIDLGYPVPKYMPP